MTPDERSANLDALVNRPTKPCSACGLVKPRAEFRSKKASRDGLAPKCLLCESEWQRQHYLRIREKRLEQCREWYEANRNRKNATSRSYRKNNKESLADARRAWLAANPGYMAEFMRKRRAQVLGSMVGDVDLESLWTGSCGICGSGLDPALKNPDPMSKSIDHIVPLARGGGHVQSNLQWAHLVCNQSKGARLPETG